MSETRILISLLRMYFPRNWEFGSALSKLRNLGEGGLNPPNPTLGTPLLVHKCIGPYQTSGSVHESLRSPARLVTADIHNGEIKETLCILYEIFLCAAISQKGYGGGVNRLV
jgi:hypothetical protein